MKYLVSFIIVYLSFGSYKSNGFICPAEKHTIALYNRDAAFRFYAMEQRTRTDSIGKMYIIDSVRIDSTYNP